MTENEINLLKDIQKQAERDLKNTSCSNVDQPLEKLLKAKEHFVKKFKGML